MPASFMALNSLSSSGLVAAGPNHHHRIMIRLSAGGSLNMVRRETIPSFCAKTNEAKPQTIKEEIEAVHLTSALRQTIYKGIAVYFSKQTFGYPGNAIAEAPLTYHVIRRKEPPASVHPICFALHNSRRAILPGVTFTEFSPSGNMQRFMNGLHSEARILQCVTQFREVKRLTMLKKDSTQKTLWFLPPSCS